MDRAEVKKTYIKKKLSKCQLSEDQEDLLEKYLVRPMAYILNNNFQIYDRRMSHEKRHRSYRGWQAVRGGACGAPHDEGLA